MAQGAEERPADQGTDEIDDIDADGVRVDHVVDRARAGVEAHQAEHSYSTSDHRGRDERATGAAGEEGQQKPRRTEIAEDDPGPAGLALQQCRGNTEEQRQHQEQRPRTTHAADLPSYRRSLMAPMAPRASGLVDRAMDTTR